MTKTKTPDLPLSGGVQFDSLKIRGVPHRIEAIRDMEKSIGGKIVTNEAALASLDAIFFDFVKKNGHPPELIEDSHTHNRYVPVKAVVPSQVEGVPLVTYLYFRLPFKVIVNAMENRTR